MALIIHSSSRNRRMIGHFLIAISILFAEDPVFADWDSEFGVLYDPTVRGEPLPSIYNNLASTSEVKHIRSLWASAPPGFFVHAFLTIDEFVTTMINGLSPLSSFMFRGVPQATLDVIIERCMRGDRGNVYGTLVCITRLSEIWLAKHITYWGPGWADGGTRSPCRDRAGTVKYAVEKIDTLLTNPDMATQIDGSRNLFFNAQIVGVANHAMNKIMFLHNDPQSINIQYYYDSGLWPNTFALVSDDPNQNISLPVPQTISRNWKSGSSFTGSKVNTTALNVSCTFGDRRTHRISGVTLKKFAIVGLVSVSIEYAGFFGNSCLNRYRISALDLASQFPSITPFLITRNTLEDGETLTNVANALPIPISFSNATTLINFLRSLSPPNFDRSISSCFVGG